MLTLHLLTDDLPAALRTLADALEQEEFGPNGLHAVDCTISDPMTQDQAVTYLFSQVRPLQLPITGEVS